MSAQPLNATPLTSVQPSGFEFVDCQLPGRVIMNGRRNVRQLPGRLVRITANRCEIHGGRYIASDRASVAGSLEAWLPQAQAGDPKAQSYVGELFEIGLGGVPDYEMARIWYARAVEKDYAPAMFNLARLYEEGLGGDQDRERANNLYYDAMGFDGSLRDKLTEIDSAQLALLRADLAEQEIIISEQEALIARLQADVDTLTLARDSKDTNVLELEQQLAAARQQLANALSTGAADRAGLQAEISAIHQQRQDVEERERTLAEREAELNALQTQISQTSAAQASDQSALIARLTADLSASREAVDRLRAEREAAVAAEQTALSSLSNAEARLSTQMAELAELEQTLAARETELVELTERYGTQSLTLRVEREDLQRERTELANTRSALAQQLDSFEQRRADLETRAAELSALEIQLAAQRQVLAEQSEELEAATMRTASLTSERENLQARMREFEQSKAQLEEAQAVYQTRLRALEAREQALAQSESQVQQTLTSVQGNEAQIDRLVQERDEARARADRLYDALLEANDRLEKMLAPRGMSDGTTPNYTEAAASIIPSIDFGKFHAILIGNENYEHAKWDDLLTPHEDVDKIAEILRANYGFETTILKDVKRDDLVRALDDITAKMGSDDNLLIYYAGHGTRIAEVGNRAMWNPVDSDPDANYTSIEFNWIKEFLKSSEARKILVVSDSCYSGVILRGTTTRLRNGTAEEHADYLRKAVQGRSRVAFSSGGVEEQALDEGGGDYSLFAAALIEALSNNRDPQPAEVLYQEIKQKVSVQADYQNHEQTPGYGEIKGADHGGGDFIFVPISALP